LVRQSFPKDTIDFASELIDVVTVGFAAACQEKIDKNQEKKILFHCFKDLAPKSPKGTFEEVKGTGLKKRKGKQ
jgi:hypothetical protein